MPGSGRLLAAARGTARRAHRALRSPLHTPEQAAAFARTVLGRPGFQLVGVMSYEAQIAGLGDAPPGRPLRAAALPLIQRFSAAELRERRGAAVGQIQALTPLEFVNGGGTGSLEVTAADLSVTELAAGSGLMGPALFDAYRRFSPRRRCCTPFRRACLRPGPASARTPPPDCAVCVVMTAGTAQVRARCGGERDGGVTDTAERAALVPGRRGGRV